MYRHQCSYWLDVRLPETAPETLKEQLIAEMSRIGLVPDLLVQGASENPNVVVFEVDPDMGTIEATDDVHDIVDKLATSFDDCLFSLLEIDEEDHANQHGSAWYKGRKANGFATIRDVDMAALVEEVGSSGQVQTLGERIKQRRESLGLTQAQLAARVGWPVTKIASYELGTSAPSIVSQSKIATALDTTVLELFSGDSAGPDKWWAEVRWNAADVIAAAERQGLAMTKEQANEWLRQNEKNFSDYLTTCGNDLLASMDFKKWVTAGQHGC